MTQEERKSIMYAQGRANALALQEKAPDMTGTELNAADSDIPSFKAADRVCVSIICWPCGAAGAAL